MFVPLRLSVVVTAPFFHYLSLICKYSELQLKVILHFCSRTIGLRKVRQSFMNRRPSTCMASLYVYSYTSACNVIFSLMHVVNVLASIDYFYFSKSILVRKKGF